MKKLNSNFLKTICGGCVLIPGEEIPAICFAENTMITTKVGQKKISNLDLTKDQVWNPVNQKWMNLSRKTVTIHKGSLATISTSSGSVTVTTNHPFLTLSGELIQAGELKIGDILSNGDTGDIITNTSFVEIEDYVLVYNLVFDTLSEVEEDHLVEANGVVSGVLYLQDKIGYKTRILEAVEY